MHKEDLQYREVASPATPMGQKYYSGGHICRVPAPSVHATSTLTPFRIIKAEEVREKHGTTTNAMEITLKIDDESRKEAIAAQMQPGLVFAFDPKNSSEVIDAVEKCLAPSPREKLDCVIVPVHSSYMMHNHNQAVPKRDALAGLMDLSRPTEQLVELLAERAEAAGQPLPLAYDAAKLAECYSVAELLQYRPGLLTLEDLYANQPPMKTRPYTISDFDREEGTVNILISGVSAELAKGDPLGIKASGSVHTKEGGTATDMMMEIATGGKKGGAPDGEYQLNGYLVTDGPKLVFPGFTKPTEALEHAMTVEHNHPLRTEYFHGLREIVEREPAPDTTLYFLATGSGMAPYMSLLRDLSRQKKENPDFEMPCKIVLVNGGRYEQDELFAEECHEFVSEGVLDTYFAHASASGRVKTITQKNAGYDTQDIQWEPIKDKPWEKLIGEHNQHTIKNGGEREKEGGQEKGGRYYIQDVLEAAYGKDMDAKLREGKAMVYVCGAQGALEGVTEKWPDAFKANPKALQHTASVPSRFFDMMRDENQGIRYHEPLPVMERPKQQPEKWTTFVRKEPRSQENHATQAHAR